MCSDCVIGKYQPLRATTSCLICQSGTYQISVGSYFCKSCGTGKYLNDAALTVGLHDQASDCKSCLNGKYLDDVGGDHEKYFIKTSGLCTDSGAGSVLSINECMAAASVLSLVIPVRSDGSDVYSVFVIVRSTIVWLAPLVILACYSLFMNLYVIVYQM